MTIRDRVRSGIKRLNKNKPGWRQKVDAHMLDMGSCKWCVLGQVTGDYHNVPLGGNGGLAVRLGFNAPANRGWEANQTYFEKLARAWVGELRTR